MTLKRGKKGLVLLMALWGAIAWMGCLSEISFSVPQYDHSQTISIRGSLVATDTPYVQVRITNISNFSASDIPVPVEGAVVVLTDESGHSLTLPMLEPGFYKLDIPAEASDLEVKPGKSYALGVTTAGGRTYSSTVETLPAVPIPKLIDTVTLQREILNQRGNLVQQEFIRFLISTPLVQVDRAQRAYLKWNFTGTYKFQESLLTTSPIPNVRTCYFTDVLQTDKVVLFNGAASNLDTLRQFLLLEEALDHRFYEGFYLTVTQQSLSKQAFDYWDQIGQVTDLSGSFFEAQPGKVRGNFRNVENPGEEVFGYFYAAEEVVLRYFIPPLPERVGRSCPLSTDNPNSVDFVCLNCLSRPGSTLTKPDFW